MRFPVPRLLIAVTLAWFCLMYFVAKPQDWYDPWMRWKLQKSHRRGYDEVFVQQSHLWASLVPMLADTKPECQKMDSMKGNPEVNIGYNVSDVDRRRPSPLVVNSQQLIELQKSHSRFVQHMRNNTHELPFRKGTRGIVTTAGGHLLPVALFSIRMLRETGSRLPVEVLLHTNEEWDPALCDVVFPELNARCVILQDIFDSSLGATTLKVEKYQFKILSILVSTFEEVLFLDADNFPVANPDSLFDSAPFRTTGMIRWPDFWFATEAPAFFAITNIAMPKVYEQASTESGQLMYAKSRHTQSLLLALYFNWYGPGFYYPLMSQGAQGEGDKETFFWAAVDAGNPVYSVTNAVEAIGHREEDGTWQGMAMVQDDPRMDYLESQDAAQRQPTKRRPLFVHANYPKKIDPASIFETGSDHTKTSDGTMTRIFHSTADESIEMFGFDLERRMFGIIQELACKYEGMIKAWEGKQNICRKARQYWRAMYAESGDEFVEDASYCVSDPGGKQHALCGVA